MRKLLILLMALVCSGLTMSQDKDSIEYGLNYGYAEVGGHYLLGVGVNYERQLLINKSLSLYVGTGLGTSAKLDRGKKGWPLIIPISGGLLVGKGRGRLALGISRLLVDKDFYTDPEDGIESILPTAFNVGYRKLPKISDTFFYKVDFLLYPAYFIGVAPFLGVGMGYNF